VRLHNFVIGHAVVPRTSQSHSPVVLRWPPERGNTGSLPGKSLRDLVSESERDGMGDQIKRARRELGDLLAREGEKPTLKAYRLRAGLSQAQLAKNLGTSQSYVARLEAGLIRDPRASRLEALATELKVRTDQIMDALRA